MVNELLTSNNIEWVAHVVVMPMILFVGFFGQTLNLITLHQTHLKSLSFLYLKAVAYAEFFSILTLIPFVVRHAYDDEQMRWPCWALFYRAHFETPLPNAFVAANTLSIVGLTVERYFSVCHPLLALKANGTPRRARFFIVVLYLLAFILFAPAAFQKKLEYSPKNDTSIFETDDDDVEEIEVSTCHDWIVVRNHALHNRKSFKIYLLFREILVRIGPTVILIVLNVLIFRAVKQTSHKRKRLISVRRFSNPRRISSRRRRPGFVKQFTKTRSESAGSNSIGSGSEIDKSPADRLIVQSQSIGDHSSINSDCSPSAVGPATPNSTSNNCVSYNDNRTLVIRYRRTRREKNDHERQRRVYVLLIVTVLTFLICTIPASVLSLLVTDDKTDEDSTAFQAFRAAANLLEVLSYSTNFYIYCLCCEDYRKMFLKWLQRWSNAISKFKWSLCH